jgi:hypothetical protein
MHRPPRPFSREHQPSPEAKSAGQAVAREIRERIAEHKEALVTAQLARALDVTHNQGHQAAVDLLNRIMPPESKQEVSGPDGGPAEIIWRIVDPATD